MALTQSSLDDISLPGALSDATVLFVDDEADATSVLVRSLQRRGFSGAALQTTTAKRALELFSQHSPEAAIVDLSLTAAGPAEGLDLISELRAIDSSARIIVLTGHKEEELGVQALSAGAASFLVKPVNPDFLMTLIADGIAATHLARKAPKAATPVAVKHGLTSKSPAMKQVLSSLDYLSACDVPVLIVGETGTGKGVIAKSLHDNHSRRRGPFVRYQPSFANSDLVASELFGHVKGAFTGAQTERRGLFEDADTGTLFLDEIDELPAATQIVLLHSLQEKKFRRIGSNREYTSDFRLLGATNRPLESLLRDGKLRTDLYYRLAHTVLVIPPLRERLEDIPDLAAAHLRNFASKKRSALGISDGALCALQSHPWPGNIRELLSVVESSAHRAMFAGRAAIEPGDLPFSQEQRPAVPTSSTFRERVNAFEYSLLREALRDNGENISRAAASLGLDRSAFRRMLRRHERSSESSS